MGSTRIGRVIAALVGGAVIAVTIVVPASVAGAHGVVDQASGSCLGNLDIDDDPEQGFQEVAQTFVPGADVLLGLDIEMAHHSGSSLTIREGGPEGAVVGTGSFEASSDVQDWVHVDLVEPVSVSPGQTYAFRFSNDATYCQSFGYAAGDLHLCRAVCDPATGADITFRTYTSSAPPDTTIDSGPADGTTESTAVFEFSGTDDVTPAGDLTFECSVDGKAFAACESGDEFDSFGVGPHTFAVRAIDGEGQVDPTPAEYTWRVDPADLGAPPGGPEASTTTSTTAVPGRVAARAASPTRSQPTFAG